MGEKTGRQTKSKVQHQDTRQVKKVKAEKTRNYEIRKSWESHNSELYTNRHAVICFAENKGETAGCKSMFGLVLSSWKIVSSPNCNYQLFVLLLSSAICKFSM